MSIEEQLKRVSAELYGIPEYEDEAYYAELEKERIEKQNKENIPP